MEDDSMFFENYGHIIKAQDLKMTEWSNVSAKRKRKNTGRDISGPPIGVLEVEKKEYVLRGWAILHKLMKTFDPHYNLSIPELKKMAYSLLLDEGIHYYSFFNSIMEDADPTKNYLLVCEKNTIKGISEHISSSPDTTFDTILCQDWLTKDPYWSGTKSSSPYHYQDTVSIVPSLIIEKIMKNCKASILIQSTKKQYIITTRITSGSFTMRPCPYLIVKKKHGFEKTILMFLETLLKTFKIWCIDNYAFHPATSISRFPGWMNEYERDDVEHELFCRYFPSFKKNN